MIFNNALRVYLFIYLNYSGVWCKGGVLSKECVSICLLCLAFLRFPHALADSVNVIYSVDRL